MNTTKHSRKRTEDPTEINRQLEQREAELSVISSIQEGIVAGRGMQEIYDLVGDRIRQLFDAQVAAVCTFNYENSTEEFHYVFEDGKIHSIDPRPIDNLRQRLIETKDLICLNENADEMWTALTGEAPSVVPGTKLTKSALYVPMVSGDTVKGYLSLQNVDRENAFSDSDVRLLSTLAESVTVALENARLFSETEQRNAELAVINSVQQGLVAEMDMQGIYELVGDRIRELFDSQVTSIVTFDHVNKTENFKYLFEDGVRFPSSERPYDAVREKIINERITLLLNERAAEEMSRINGQVHTPLPGTRIARSALFVPLIVGDTVRGYVTLQHLDRENVFSDSDVRLLTTLGNSMSVALENARLFNETSRLLGETEQRAAELETVNSISHALVSQLDLKSLIKLIGDQMKATFKADIVYLALYDRQTNILDFPYMYGDNAKPRPFGNGITEKIILNREPLLINQDLEKVYDRIEAEKSGKWVESYLGVPIIAGNESIGVISVQSTAVQNRFTANDLRLLTTIAANVGVAMQNAEAYRKLQTALTDLKSVQQQLIQQEKLASLGQLTAGIAHEIKNPLNFVNNFSELNVELIDEVFEELSKLEKSAVTEDIREILLDVRSNLTKIHQHGTRADGIVKSMLQHSRGGSGKIEPTDLNSLIKEYVNLSFHGMRAGKKPINVSIDLQLDEEVGLVPLIGEDFSRVILNLCNNAFDAMRERSSSGSGNGAYQPKLTVRTIPEAPNILIQVEDNGPGIPEASKDKILQPFFTTKKGTEGTGLGLSITHDIIKAHSGTLGIVSEKDSFTRFEITIPANIKKT